MFRYTAALIALSLPFLTEQAFAQVDDATWHRITSGLDGFMEQAEQMQEFPPGAAVIVVTDDGRRYIRMHGVLNAQTGAPATAESEFYIASMTKAYVGLLAARLDAEGVFPLTTTLAEVWPDLQMPEGRDAMSITMRDLLSHQAAISADEIGYLEAYVRDVAPSEYPGLIERYATARESGFQYSNLGYNIYAAALEQVTEINWRDWLDQDVFTPLGLDQTSGRTSDFDPADVAWGHRRTGAHQDDWPRANGWYLIPPKPDGMMQSAGGLMTSASDMARWMEIQLTGETPARSGITPAMIALTHDTIAVQQGDGDGFTCDGYGFGWNVCEYLYPGDAAADFGTILQHGGGYTGYRTGMTLAPDLGLGVAVFTNSDSMTGFLSLEITKQALELALDLPAREQWQARRLDVYGRQNQRYLDHLQNQVSGARADAQWNGWSWAPAADELATYTGTYSNPDFVLGSVEIEAGETGLVLRSDALTYQLEPASPDLFGGQTNAYSGIDNFTFLRGEDGSVVALDWDGDRLERVQ
ncbi:serine hydrolase [Hyphobacterium marinum]|uniref:Serine hydrolase n=1 Tax=Hyphobacterium marinum TaxID=3116574 RepID=A0ABU7LXV4_9PROT|nr:serine hydrolase [Hyphobacterium sp. Y6023]MEE2566383.1 serine hydrolase [Hyphobacterium sp. Y6023]